MLIPDNDRPVHFPANPSKFQFDSEVAAIFPNMARRSIPNYELAHEMHARVAATHFLRDGGSVIDIGASRGGFYKALFDFYEEMGHPVPDMRMVATDNSAAMCAGMALDFPLVEVRQQDILGDEFMRCIAQYDVVSCMYVLQFLPVDRQVTILRKLASMVKPGGVLLLGQKEAHSGLLGAIIHDQYVQFRLDNGYTLEEIDAKTKALANAMWPMPQKLLLDNLRHAGFREVIETTRYTVFSTVMCLK